MTTSNQRWRDRVATFRPSREQIDTSAYEVSATSSDKVAREFVERHHYSGSYPAARERVLLHRRATGELVGVAVFSHPPSEKVLARLPCERLEGVELGRFVLLDGVPGNGESWFLARAFDHLRAEGYAAVISHSDPMPRRALDGEIVLPGHVGEIYQATNATYCGRTKKTLLALLPDGTVFSARSMTKIRRRERGYRYAIEQLVAAGAAPPASDLMSTDEFTAWMWGAIGSTCRRARHNGNHRYAWALGRERALRRGIAALAVRVDDGTEAGATYPKTLDREAA